MPVQKIVETKLFPALFHDRRLHANATLMRIQLQYSPVDTLAGHQRRWGKPKETLRLAIQRLVKCGWAYELPQQDRRSALIVPWMPSDVEKLVAAELEQVRNEVAFIGEWLMKCILFLIVDDRDYRYNVRPAWLNAGDGRGNLEIDYWQRGDRVAIEFQGMQHYRLEPVFHKDKGQFLDQQVRDYVKAGLCIRNGAKYIEISAVELSFEAIVAKIQGILPLRPIPMDGPIVRTLENMCQSYVNSVHRALRRSNDMPPLRR